MICLRLFTRRASSLPLSDWHAPDESICFPGHNRHTPESRESRELSAVGALQPQPTARELARERDEESVPALRGGDMVTVTPQLPFAYNQTEGFGRPRGNTNETVARRRLERRRGRQTPIVNHERVANNEPYAPLQVSSGSRFSLANRQAGPSLLPSAGGHDRVPDWRLQCLATRGEPNEPPRRWRMVDRSPIAAWPSPLPVPGGWRTGARPRRPWHDPK